MKRCFSKLYVFSILIACLILLPYSSFASTIAIYINFGSSNEQFTVKEISVNNINFEINKTFQSTNRRKQFLVKIITDAKSDNTNISTITLNGKTYYLDKPIYLKGKYDVKGIFINYSPNGIFISSQHILSAEKKLFVSIPESKAIGVIDEDKQKIIGFIGTKEIPSGIAVVNDKVYCGMKNSGTIKIFCALSGSHLKTISIPGCSGIKEIKKIKDKIAVLDNDEKTLFIYDTNSEAINTFSFLHRIISFLPLKETNIIALSTVNIPENIILISVSNGKTIKKISLLNNINSLEGDKENLYGTEDTSNTVIKYSLIDKRTDILRTKYRPIFLRKTDRLLTVSTSNEIVFIDTMSLFPYKTLPIKNIVYLQPDSEKGYLYCFSKKYGKVNIINLNSLTNIGTINLISTGYRGDTN